MIAAGDLDRSVGMEYFITDTAGCGGSIKGSAEDFVVSEVFQDFSYEGGRYLVLEVEKTNWDTHRLIREMARQLKISQKRFAWAGTKDKRAVTSQRISIMNLDEQALADLHLPDLKIRVLGRTNRAVGLGDLLGNSFKIVIRDLACPDPADRMARITEQIKSHKGVPNYFGLQRFGDKRPVTHLVGEALARGKMEDAVFIYLALPFPAEPEETRLARERLWEQRDIREGLKYFPEYLNFELAMMNYLAGHPGDYAGSFDVLSLNLKRLFVHAYQSYLFNRILSRRLAAGLPLHEAAAGDVVCFSKEGRPDTSKVQTADEESLAAINRLAERGRAYVTLPLIGYDTALADGESTQGRIEKQVMAEEGIDRESFRIPDNPDLGSPGTRRAAWLTVLPQIRVDEDAAEMQFFLPKGSYATVVLREYMK
ncbi:MAG TPA: tRNA pseudouridine(13) synthase TruD [Methanothrix sp.]|nr:tRNA pseudouridine(13) synthase TruD [Methanothrix sp.]HPT19709.1 tRNA pseudouridine(13) synthase TruD [Methanothrix sp.]